MKIASLFIILIIFLCPVRISKTFQVAHRDEVLFSDFNKHVFNDELTKNLFLSYMFRKFQVQWMKNRNICSLKNQIIKENYKLKYVNPQHLESAFNLNCYNLSENTYKLIHNDKEIFIYKTDDKNKFCSETQCLDILSQSKNDLNILWDDGERHLFKKNKEYEYQFVQTSGISIRKDVLNNIVEFWIVSGGIGNRLFSYWSSVIYALKNNKKPYVMNPGFLSEVFDLPFLNEKPVLKHHEQSQIVKRRIDNLVKHFRTDHEIHPDGNYTFVGGYMQSWKNLIGYENYIRKNTIFKYPISQKNQEIINKMQNENAVCIHVRRGDYVDNGYVLLKNEYYMKAVDYIKRNIENPYFYVFSNDILWSKDNLTIDAPHMFVDWNQKDYEDLHLMTKCKHFITANSTFSWWGAFLSEYKDKLIIAPDKHAKWNPKWQEFLMSPDHVIITVDKE